ncbi:MAG: DUF1016 domain-containing protein [Erysipelotrichaceae bacterium]|nr:DUF1016 domain-containing protein [Erysipelotrichaceae bacterium]
MANGWSVRNLERARHSRYYERLLSTQSKGASSTALPKQIDQGKILV